MTSTAAVILAHRDPTHLHRLVAALQGVPIFLHVDQRTPEATFREMVNGLPDRITICPRRRTALASWSLVEAELDGLRAAVRDTSAEHVLVLSGSDYPLTSMAELEAELDLWRDRSRLMLAPVPIWFWDTPRHRDGGLWRFRHRFFTVRGKILHVAGVPVRWPVPRTVPGELKPHASSQWKVLARRHVEVLLDVLADRPDIFRFWRTTLVPDESCIASILKSPALVGPVVDRVHNELPWFIDWVPGADHPNWLTSRQFGRIEQARWAPPRGPDHPDLADALSMDSGRKLIARKFSSSVDHEVLDRIDEVLRV